MPTLPEVTALVRSIARSNPDDSREQAVSLERVQELRAAIPDTAPVAPAGCLDAAAVVLELLSRSGPIQRQDLLDAVYRLIQMVEQNWSDVLDTGEASVSMPKLVVGVAASSHQTAAAAPAASEETELQLGVPGDTPTINDMVLGEILIQLGFVSRDDVGVALGDQVSNPEQRIGRILVDSGNVTLAQVQSGVRLQAHLRSAAAAEAEELRSASDQPGERDLPPAPDTLTRDMLLGEILSEMEMVNKEQLVKAIGLKNSSGIKIGEALIEIGAATQAEIDYALDVQKKLLYVSGVSMDDDEPPLTLS